jgi:phosphate transport system permease protein
VTPGSIKRLRERTRQDASPEASGPGSRDTELHGGRNIPDRVFQGLALAAGLTVLVVLGLILMSTTKEAWPAFRHEGLGFVTSSVWIPGQDRFGALAFVYGTLVVSAIALLLAVPVSIGLALFITELAPRAVRAPVVYLVDLLAAIPSVVYGLWGVLVFGPHVVKAFDWVAARLDGVPVLGALAEGPASQRSFATAGIILAIMITPIITSISKEVFATVPREQKEGALALGATRWEMMRGAIFPYSRTGLIGAVMLGLGRAMGETIAVALMIGSVPDITARLFGPADAMAAVIANQFGEASGVHRAALIGLGVVLFIMTVVVNLLARAVTSRADRHLAGGAA